MKTVLISRSGGVPAPLSEIVARGSTVLEECAADELADHRGLEGDRFVFWSGSDDERLRRIAEAYVKDAPVEQRQRLLFVLADAASAERPDLPPDQLFIWPQDEDRLKLAFLTGA